MEAQNAAAAQVFNTVAMAACDVWCVWGFFSLQLRCSHLPVLWFQVHVGGGQWVGGGLVQWGGSVRGAGWCHGWVGFAWLGCR